MILSHSRRFIFVHVHKTAGEAVTAALVPHLGREDVVVESDYRVWLRKLIYRRYRALNGVHKHDSASALQDRLPTGCWDEYFTFAVVRDPVERAVSLYRYIGMVMERRTSVRWRNAWYATPPGRRMDPARWLGARAYLESSSFSEFVRHPDALADPGMQPQVVALCGQSGQPLVDYVGKFECLDRVVSDIGTRLGLSGLTLPRVNVSRGAGIARVEVSSDDRQYLEHLYRADLRTFGY